MTPVTPPRSRERRSSVGAEKEFSMTERDAVPPETPHRFLQDRGPVTPSTTKSHKEPTAPLLLPPKDRISFQCYNSPEFTPFREATGDEQEGIPSGDLRKVSRVLFPRSGKEDNLKGSAPTELLPPIRPTSSRRKYRSESPTRVVDVPQQHKQPKQVPGTPSHQVTTFELAKKWHNNTGKLIQGSSDEESGEEEVLIKKTAPENPFLSSSPVDPDTRAARKQSLLEKDPDVENVITYLNKNGEVVKRHHVSNAEKEAYKPRRLFAKELQELESDKAAAKGTN
ncbi:ZYBA0S15-01244g1_1 [Zygosaccharomyces bailii CLIB 213]|uniref:ZYBA0S15-01244g1_1 n=1 Tax=Zygosaccharomyces bailii (strain CLIB 213 / ATCC 58445 / CBS 680 / BCRC 21525 / NBRC 1098 / NCYC 1416 / NRRL Y-2227) TaxID=1333698 RepID=A0A8J2TAM0_ZYGB2|nr:ZYBA0S15-01244g1_1 [Zygosaccharomyces bailii CLIB 213]